MKSIFDINKKLDEDYNGEISITEGLNYSLKETIRQIDFISNSKYIDGGLDQFGREMPYYNITNYRLNVAIRATDFDTKDIQIVSETRDYIRSLLIGKRVKQWIKENRFSSTINRIGEKTPKYGFTLVKKVFDENGKLEVQVVRHTNAVVNQSDIFDSPIKEKHPAMSQMELLDMKDVWDEAVIDELIAMDLEEYDICEITGRVPESTIKDGGDEKKYVLAKVFLYEASKADKGKVLYSKELKGEIQDYYRICSWAEQDGRLPRGVVEDMFEAQFGTNEVKLLERDATIMASKTGFVTDSDTLANNVLTDLDNGFILNIDEGKSFNQVNTMTNALPAFDRLAEAWDNQAEKVTSTFDAVTGETMPSSTPFRSVAIQNQEASSLFIYRRENIGIFYTDLFNDWIIPEVVKDINKNWILSAEFTAEELNKIDEAFGLYSANDVVKEKIKNLELDTTFNFDEYRAMVDAYKDIAKETGNIRFLDIPKDYFKDFKFKVSVITTNEQRNKSATLESLSNILGQVANTFDPNTGTFSILENPALASIFGRIIELSGAGISPATLSQLSDPKAMPKPQVEEPAVTPVDPALISASNQEQA